MRKLYDEYFYIPEGGKVREKVMLARVATSVAIVILCLAVMGFTAYAYFSADLTSQSNKIKAAKFDIDVEVNGTEGEVELDGLKAELTAGTYTVTLKHGEASTAKSGYVVMTVSGSENEEDYYTTQLTKDANGDPVPMTFTIKVTGRVMVSFRAYLGTSIHYVKYTEASENGEPYVDDHFIVNNGEITLVGDTTDEDASDLTDEKGPETDSTEPTGPSTPEPSKPDEPSTPEPSEPDDPSASEPSKPDEPAAPEPSEPDEPSTPETSLPGEGAEPENSDASPAQSEPEASEPDGPVDGAGEEPIDASADEPTDELGE